MKTGNLIARRVKVAVMHIRLTVQPRIRVLNNCQFEMIFREACRADSSWRVGGYTIMPDHLHFFCEPGEPAELELSEWIRQLKRTMRSMLKSEDESVIAPREKKNENAISNSTRVSKWSWQRGYKCSVIRSLDEYERACDCVSMNPVRDRLVLSSNQWPYTNNLDELIVVKTLQDQCKS